LSLLETGTLFKQSGFSQKDFLFEGNLNLIFENWLVNELSKEMF